MYCVYIYISKQQSYYIIYTNVRTSALHRSAVAATVWTQSARVCGRLQCDFPVASHWRAVQHKRTLFYTQINAYRCTAHRMHLAAMSTSSIEASRRLAQHTIQLRNANAMQRSRTRGQGPRAQKWFQRCRRARPILNGRVRTNAQLLGVCVCGLVVKVVVLNLFSFSMLIWCSLPYQEGFQTPIEASTWQSLPQLYGSKLPIVWCCWIRDIAFNVDCSIESQDTYWY